MNLLPITIKAAKKHVAEHHRHHKPPVCGLFALAAQKDGKVVGVIIVGRPVARGLDDDYTAEITRCCTDGTKNACSFLYAAAWKAARALGYQRAVTYTLPEEGGASLRACGWREDGTARGGSWSCVSRPREDKHPLGEKVRWAVETHDYIKGRVVPTRNQPEIETKQIMLL